MYGGTGEVATFDIAINYVAHVPKLHNLNIPQSSLSVHSVGAKKIKLSFVANIALKKNTLPTNLYVAFKSLYNFFF